MEPITLGRQRHLAGDVFIGLVVVATLYLARQVLVPIAVAVLLSFVLNPLVERLRRLNLPEMPAVAAVVVIAFIVVAGVAGIIGLQLTELAGDLPRYRYTLEEKVRSLREAAGGSRLTQSVSEFMQGIEQAISRPPPAPQQQQNPAPSTSAEKPPMPVTVVSPPARPLETIQTIAGPLVEPVVNAGIVVVFVIFILVQRRDLRDRLIWLTGARDLRRATLAIDDAAERLARYLSTQTVINSVFGVTVTVGLWLIGLPNPLLWGVLACLLRFVPYVGTFIALALPLGLAAAVDPGWSKVLWTIGLFGVVELTISQAIEPLLYGRMTGLSPIAVVVAATFWTWLWGPIGLFLSIPLTMLIVVLGQHVESLTFLAVLFGNAPALTPAQGFFQRVMMGNADEAAEQGERYLKQQSLASYYDEVALPGLRMAQLEANAGTIEPQGLRAMAETVDDIIANFDEPIEHGKAGRGSDKSAKSAPQGESEPADVTPAWRRDGAVLCIAGRSPLDEAAAKMLRQLLAQRGIGAKVASFGEFTWARISEREMEGVVFVCLSYLAVVGTPSHPKFLIRRLRRRSPGMKILAGFWTYDNEGPALDELTHETGADAIATSLQAAVEICQREAARGGEPTLPEEARIDAVADRGG